MFEYYRCSAQLAKKVSSSTTPFYWRTLCTCIYPSLHLLDPILLLRILPTLLPPAAFYIDDVLLPIIHPRLLLKAFLLILALV